ncbi:MBL fold hydrolase [Mycolicibacterium litorale]|uniref:MBL fold hydrolase n=1 Tax=Mycolicibacterium litorale TaxID=758802 RepID=A0A6S6P329_9MYCO|nr:MBL fold metallo-hydrolase [Mycolicibacterium litorale]BCI51981.1 MBL fold hydrolase [Mycolicibacterium litorale]
MSTGPLPVGRPGDPSAVRSLRVDDLVATYVVDGVLAIPLSFFPRIPGDYWSARPEWVSPAGRLRVSAGGLLVESDGVTLLIDAGVGAVRREVAVGGVDCGALLDVLAATGRSPGDIDVVAFTHLHFDHAGGAFVDGRKTFPNARYVLSAAEWAPHADGDHRGDEHSPSHVLRDLARTPLELIDDGAEILPGVRAIVTGGHTPGHTAYVITSRTGRRLIAFGDAFQIPAHLAHPEWFSTADADHSGVLAARRRLLDELHAPDTFGFGFHFGDQAFGRVTGVDTWTPVPTVVLGPSPR